MGHISATSTVTGCDSNRDGVVDGFEDLANDQQDIEDGFIRPGGHSTICSTLLIRNLSALLAVATRYQNHQVRRTRAQTNSMIFSVTFWSCFQVPIVPSGVAVVQASRCVHPSFCPTTDGWAHSDLRTATPILRVCYLFFFALLSVFSTGCTQLVGQDVRLSGIINKVTADNIIDRFGSNNVLHVTHSPGGDSLSALHLAEFLNDNNKKLVINGVCASACVTLFIATNNAEVGDAALFLSHSSVLPRVDMIRRSLRFLGNSDDITINLNEAMFELHEIVYSNWSLTQQAEEATAVTGPICSGLLKGDHVYTTWAGRTTFQAEYDFWVPEITTLKRWRDNRSFGDPSAYDSSLLRRFSRHEAFLSKFRVRPRIVDEEVQRAHAWFVSEQYFPFCQQ